MNKESLTSFLAILNTSLHAPVKLLPVTQSWDNNYSKFFLLMKNYSKKLTANTTLATANNILALVHSTRP